VRLRHRAFISALSTPMALFATIVILLLTVFVAADTR
jgi:hypothetical protein